MSDPDISDPVVPPDAALAGHRGVVSVSPRSARRSGPWSRREFLAAAGAGVLTLGACDAAPPQSAETRLLKGALNGGRQPGSHPALPTTPDEFAEAARGAVQAGAGAIHAHVRDAAASESVRAEDVGRIVTALRAAVPNTPIGVSTHFGIVGDAEQRHALVTEWSVLPDFASVNFNEPGAPALAELLMDKGVGVEAGLFDAEATTTCVESGLAPDCLRLMMEPRGGDFENAARNVAEMEAVLDNAEVDRPRLLHGFRATAWQLIELAAQLGYDTRAGLEDTFELADGPTARDNAEIVAAAARLIASVTG